MTAPFIILVVAFLILAGSNVSLYLNNQRLMRLLDETHNGH